MRTFIAYYRYRIPHPAYKDGELNDTQIEIISTSLKDAKRTAKNMEGQDGRTWLMEVRKKEI